MASTTPPSAPVSRSASRTRKLPSRPTTPLRPPSRTSLRASTTTPTSSLRASSSSASVPLEALEPSFGELADGMADLEANMMHLQLLHESLTRFNECFGGFLYGLNMSAFCVDFPEAPGVESFKRAQQAHQNQQDAVLADSQHAARDVDATFLTTDTSFVENPPTPRTAKTSKTSMVPPPSSSSARHTRAPASTSSRGRGTAARGGRAGGLPGSTRPSGLARGRGRGVIR